MILLVAALSSHVSYSNQLVWKPLRTVKSVCADCPNCPCLSLYHLSSTLCFLPSWVPRRPPNKRINSSEPKEVFIMDIAPTRVSSTLTDLEGRKTGLENWMMIFVISLPRQNKCRGWWLHGHHLTWHPARVTVPALSH